MATACYGYMFLADWRLPPKQMSPDMHARGTILRESGRARRRCQRNGLQQRGMHKQRCKQRP